MGPWSQTLGHIPGLPGCVPQRSLLSCLSFSSVICTMMLVLEPPPAPAPRKGFQAQVLGSAAGLAHLGDLCQFLCLPWHCPTLESPGEGKLRPESGANELIPLLSHSKQWFPKRGADLMGSKAREHTGGKPRDGWGDRRGEGRLGNALEAGRGCKCFLGHRRRWLSIPGTLLCRERMGHVAFLELRCRQSPVHREGVRICLAL